MLINGLWYLCDDGIIRPVIRGEILTSTGTWAKVPFLIDTGADRTVISSDVLATLGLPAVAPSNQLSGFGGIAATVLVDSEIRLTCDDGSTAVFRGRLCATTQPEALDMSVLGRDVTNLFAVIVDRPRDRVCLLGQRHEYTISLVP